MTAVAPVPAPAPAPAAEPANAPVPVAEPVVATPAPVAAPAPVAEPTAPAPVPAPAKLRLDLTRVAPLDADLIAKAAGHRFECFFTGPPGQEAYTLLAHVSKQLPAGSLVLDLSECGGLNALALSANKGVRVQTTDSLEVDAPVTHVASPGPLADAAVVHIDCPQYATPEFLATLKSQGFRGVAIVDDIRLNQEMRALWTHATQTYSTLDITRIGHGVGTGLVVFDDAVVVV